MTKSCLLIACLLVGSGVLLSGCGVTGLYEQRIFVAHNPKTQAETFFRVTIQGDASMSVVNYRAGWQASDAVDEVFNDKKAPFRDPNAAWQEDLNGVAHTIFDKIKANVTNMSQSDFEKNASVLTSDLAQAINLPATVRAKRTTESPSAPADKYVIAFAADPNPIFQQLAAVSQRQANQGALVQTFATIQGKEYIQQHAKELFGILTWTAVHAKANADAATVDPKQIVSNNDAIKEDNLTALRNALTSYKNGLTDFDGVTR